jgi:hypothetical protein
MADLSYNDVSRAASDGTRDIMNQVRQLQSQIQQMGNVHQAVTLMNTLNQQTISMSRQLQALSMQINRMSQQSSGGSTASLPDPRLTTVIQDLKELKSRFVAFERFAQDMSDYFREEHDRHQRDLPGDRL